MPSGHYSYIDIAALDAVRARFAAGDAMVLLTPGLDEVIWANGEGAALLGHSRIGSIIGRKPEIGFAAKRQIMAAPGYPHIGRDRAITVRMASGLTSRALSFLASEIALPDGEDAILLAAPAAAATWLSPAETAARAITGLDQAGQHAAIVDAEGKVVASSGGFEGLGIGTDALGGLVAEAEGERLIKRMIEAGTAFLPAGFVRLTDAPATHLLVVVDEAPEEMEAETLEEVPAQSEEEFGPPYAPPETSPSIASESAEASTDRADVARQIEEPAPEAGRHRNGERQVTEPEATDLPASTTAATEDAEAESAGETASSKEASEQSDEPAAPGEIRAAEEELTPAEAPEPPEGLRAALQVDRSAAPVRFVWKTDAEGQFSEISEDFARTVGRPAADLIGVRFRDAAARLGIDPGGEIAGLLERRDTWSGRSVLWPVAGTDLRIPVDLAALPAYSRDRQFAGFRGFGVARAGDAVTDPNRTGLALIKAKTGEPDDAVTVEVPAPAADEAVAHAGNGPAEDSVHRENVPAQPETDPFEGEAPALSIAGGQDRRLTDKVIRLAEHRSPNGDQGLSAGERNAFREIGERLRKESEETIAETPAELRADNDSHPARQAVEEPAGDEASEAARIGDDLEAAAETIGKLLAESEDERPFGTGEAEEAAQPARRETADEGAAGDEEKPAEVHTIDGAVVEVITPAPGPSAQRGGERSDIADLRQTSTALAGTAATPSPSRLWGGVRGEDTAAPGFLPSAFATGPSPARPPVDTTILEQLPVPVLIHSGDVLHYANREFLEFTGYESIGEFEEAGGLGALFGEPYSQEDDEGEEGRKLRLRTSEGLEYPVEALLQSVPWGEGKALLLSLRRSWRQPVTYPATPSSMLQAPVDPELEARIAEMRAIVDTATDGVVLIAPDGAIRSISRPAEALFGFDSADVAGKPFTSLFAIESQRAARDYLAGLSENGVASVLNDGREVIGREAQGRFIPLFMTIGRLPNDSGFCAVMRDITQWKRAEEELTQARAEAERASSQKTEFLARVSHEIRTPLNAIIGFSELMLDEKFGPILNDRYRDYLRDINRSGNHVLDLVNDLLDISKIEAGQQDMSYEAVSLNDTLAETVAMMQPQANRERVIIRSSFASRLPEVVADLRSVRQIALNLMSNAIRYTPAGGQVIVSTAYEASGDVVMRVRDTGIGMSQAEIEQALKPFKQINALKRPRGDGTGLGLPLTKAMVEANRARFMINSTPGEGTLVEITFPSTRVLAD